MKNKNYFILLVLFLSALQIKAQYSFDNVLYGAAYYHEYMPYERLDEDIRLMKRAGLTVVRVGESAWGVFEPQDGTFEFEWMDRILDKMHAAGIKVILGTPTYSIPAWLAYKHPEVLAEHAKGNKAYYGIRQNMDFTNPTYQFYCERIIRKMLERYAQHPAVIGYQVDNETEARGVNNRDYFFGFRNYIKQKFNNDLNLLAKEWGMNYWGMNINTWEEFYPRDGVTSPSYKNEWERYNRKEVADFLNWQCDLVNEYKRKDQFVTHCFMPDFHNIDQVESFRQMQYPAINVYHDVQDKQDGQRIAYAGDFVRTVADNNYIVMETNAQGIGWDARTQFPPYDNQLRQNVYAHYASGANMVEYWHWHSIHNSFETYWKGLLSHDLEPNPTYREAGVFGREIAKPEVGERLVHLKKHNKVAIMVSNESLTALDWFLIEAGFPFGGTLKYNDVVRNVYDALFELNVECDFVPSDAPAERLAKYEMIVTPALYCASQETTDRLRAFVENGGHLVSTMRSFVTDDEVTVWHDRAPHNLTDVFGMTYNQFTRPNGHVSVEFAGALAETASTDAQSLIELLNADADTEVLASYGHYAWKDYAAVTRHAFGKGDAEWVATLLDADSIRAVMREAVEHAGVEGAGTALAGQVAVRQGVNALGENVTYLLNYSADEVTVASPIEGEVVVAPVVIATDGSIDEVANAEVVLKEGAAVKQGDPLTIGRWNVAVIAD